MPSYMQDESTFIQTLRKWWPYASRYPSFISMPQADHEQYTYYLFPEKCNEQGEHPQSKSPEKPLLDLPSNKLLSLVLPFQFITLLNTITGKIDFRYCDSPYKTSNDQPTQLAQTIFNLYKGRLPNEDRAFTGGASPPRVVLTIHLADQECTFCPYSSYLSYSLRAEEIRPEDIHYTFKYERNGDKWNLYIERYGHKSSGYSFSAVSVYNEYIPFALQNKKMEAWTEYERNEIYFRLQRHTKPYYLYLQGHFPYSFMPSFFDHVNNILYCNNKQGRPSFPGSELLDFSKLKDLSAKLKRVYCLFIMRDCCYAAATFVFIVSALLGGSTMLIGAFATGSLALLVLSVAGAGVGLSILFLGCAVIFSMTSDSLWKKIKETEIQPPLIEKSDTPHTQACLDYLRAIWKRQGGQQPNQVPTVDRILACEFNAQT